MNVFILETALTQTMLLGFFRRRNAVAAHEGDIGENPMGEIHFLHSGENIESRAANAPRRLDRFHAKAALVRALVFAPIALVPWGSFAQTDQDPRNWGYCAPPYPPACAGAPNPTPEAQLACQKAVEDYVAWVFRYRACLTSETERAVREANQVLQALKCAKDKKLCQVGTGVDRAPTRP